MDELMDGEEGEMWDGWRGRCGMDGGEDERKHTWCFELGTQCASCSVIDAMAHSMMRDRIPCLDQAP